MNKDIDEKAGPLLDIVERARQEASDLLSEKWDPVFNKDRIELVKEYLSDSTLACTTRLGNIAALIKEITRVREQLQEERDTVAQRRHLFFNALHQMDKEFTDKLLERIKAIESGHPSAVGQEFSDMSVREAAKLILERAGHPLQSADIVKALLEGGKKLADNASSIVSAALRTGSAVDEFVAIKEPGEKLRWALKKWAQSNEGSVTIQE